MIQFKSLVQYTRVVDGIRFPQSNKEPFLLVYFSENSSLIEDYPKMNLRLVDLKHVVVPLTKIPRTRMTPAFKKIYKQYKLLPYASNMAFPKNRNLLYDLSNYLNAIDIMYKPTTYRQRAGFLINNAMLKAFAAFPSNYQKTLVYSIDMTKDLNTFVNRKIFPLLRHIKDGELYFDNLILAMVGETDTRYRLLIKDGEFKFNRVFQLLRRIKAISSEEEKKEEVKNASQVVYSTVSNKLDDSGKGVVKHAIHDYLSKDSKTFEKAVSDELSSDEMKRVAVASVLFKVNGNMEKSKRLARAIPAKKLSTAVKKISKQYKDEILQPQETVNTSESVVSNQSNIPKRIDNKSPEHIFNKRQIDFQTNLKKDLVNAFKVLETQDIPLKFKSFKMADRAGKFGEIRKSDVALITVTLIDKFGNEHIIQLEIPKIDPNTGTFRVNGERKCLINQISINPISFPKEYDSKFESSYSAFHIYSKRTKTKHYLEAYMGSFRLPYIILLSYAFGFEKTLKQYKIKHTITETKPSKDKVFSKVPSSYIVFDGLDTDLKKELAASFIQAKVMNYKIEQEFGSKKYFNDLIIAITGRVDSTYLISNNVKYIVDPIAKQVLINQQLPNNLPVIMEYMATKAVTGFVQDRNDITNQRIRNSEILVHLAQKQILAAYTDYKNQVLSGNKDAKLTLQENKLMSQFVNLEIVQNMEYANPIEEMATITKVSPVGKSVGGIPDKQAIQLDARNVHPSYFGNIDPLDTAEGGNIGITQQLTIDAYITSARGMFSQKDITNKENSGMLSTTTAMIPFIENNEGARVIMAANQAKQMLPLKNPEAPIIQSGYESTLTNVLSDAFVKRSPCNGKIISISKDTIGMMCRDNKKHRIDITPQHLKSGSGVDTLSVFTPRVVKGQSVKTKQILAEGGCVSNGSISLGRTISACYMAYKGYNFEDGIVISESLVKKEKLTSLHGIAIEVTVEEGDRIVKLAEIGQKTKKGDPLFVKAIGNLEELLGGTLDEEEDESADIYDGKYIKKSPGGTIVDIEVFSNLKEGEFPKLKPLIDRTNKKYKKPSKEKFKDKGTTIKGILITFKIEQELSISLGDKLCNRFGNKGIVSLVEKEELMPRTPWGERVEIVLNPLGVLGRMNMGQMFELYCGLISKTLASKILKSKNKAEVVKLFRMVLTKLDTSPGKQFASSFIKNINGLGPKQFKAMVDQIKISKSVPLIIPPFKAPSHKDIADALKVLGLKTGYKLKLPEYNTTTKNNVPFGYVYMSKLEHIGANKIHSRSTGPMVSKTSQPTGGKRKEGGQRIGEGDTYALLSYNCPTVLSELMGPLSDDVATKKEIESDIIQTGSAEFRETKVSPTKDLLNAYFIALMLGQ